MLGVIFIPKMLINQTRYKLIHIQKTVDELTVYLYENQDVLQELDNFQMPSRHASHAEGSNTMRKINGKFVEVVPQFTSYTRFLDIEKFLAKHPIVKVPVWEHNLLEFHISHSYAKSLANRPPLTI
jgi:hypothetical protein